VLRPDRADQELLCRARRALEALDVPTRVTPSGDVLKGELTVWEGLANPVSGEAIRHICFTLAGDGRLQLDDPPALRGLEGPDCLAARTLDDLVDPIRQGLARRMAGLQELCTKLRRLGVEPEPDAERIVASVRVNLDALGVAVLEASDRGLVGRSLVPVLGSDRSAIALGGFEVPIDDATDRVDLELMVGARVEAARKECAAPQGRHAQSVAAAAAETPAAAPAAETPATKEALPLAALARALGEGAMLQPGFAALRRFRVGDRDVWMELRHREAQRFDAELAHAGGTLWAGSLDLETVGELEEVVCELLDAAPRGASAGAGGVAHSAPDAGIVAGLRPPAAGEVWVMEVRVEEDDGHEIRYRGVDVGGTAFGAPRVLPKAAFDAAYVAAPGGHRMLVQVVEVGDDSASYQRLDVRRAPVGTPKRCPLVVFLANFAAEEASF
jgi:hypothetical protein